MSVREEVAQLLAEHVVGDTVMVSGLGATLDVEIRCSCKWRHFIGTVPKTPGAMDGISGQVRRLRAGHFADVLWDADLIGECSRVHDAEVAGDE